MMSPSSQESHPVLFTLPYARGVEDESAVSVVAGVDRPWVGHIGMQTFQPAQPEAGRSERLVWVRQPDHCAVRWVM